MTEERYCPSCGEMVDTLVMVKTGKEELICACCGMVFRDTEEIRTLRAVLAAEDSPLLLRKVSEMLEAKEVARTVIPCQNGEVFLENAVSRLRAGLPVSLAILDVNMPILNGINAATAIRAIERGMGMAKKIPILFFTSHKCDNNFQKVLKYCTPAHYINKGVGSSPEDFAERLYNVIAGLLQEHKE